MANDKNPVGRPTKYKEEFIDKADEYLMENQDSIEVDSDIKVQLPTIEGFAGYIDINKDTLYEWGVKYPKFSDALDKIRREQLKRLVNEGLSGRYNSTIAKLMLANNHGMSDKQDTDVKGSLMIGEIKREVIDP
jgi:hypothetical protein